MSTASTRIPEGTLVDTTVRGPSVHGLQVALVIAAGRDAERAPEHRRKCGAVRVAEVCGDARQRNAAPEQIDRAQEAHLLTPCAERRTEFRLKQPRESAFAGTREVGP